MREGGGARGEVGGGGGDARAAGDGGNQGTGAAAYERLAATEQGCGQR
jgi:hypothetical protein